MGADTQCIKKRMRVHIYINRGSEKWYMIS